MKGESVGPHRRREGTWTGTRSRPLRGKQRKPCHQMVEEAEVSDTKTSFGLILLALYEVILQKGQISLKSLEAISVLCKSMAWSNGGLSSSKGADKLPLGRLIQAELALGWCS